MWKNYLKIAFRNLAKDKLFSAINLFGLSIGLAACLTIFVYVRQEANYDRFHSKWERIYRVNRSFMDPEGGAGLELGAVAPPIGPLLKAEIPGIEQQVRFLEYDNVAMQRADRVFLESNLLFAEENLFKVFDFSVLDGNPATALKEPFSVMLSDEMAQKYFPKGDYMDQEVLLFSSKVPFIVKGVFQHLPVNSHFHPNFLFSFGSLNDERLYGKERLQTNWFNNAFFTYLLLAPGTQPEAIASRFDAFLDKHLAAFADEPNPKKKPHETTQLYLKALNDIHLDSHTDSEFEENGNRSRVWMFALVALFILGIACINYMNLSTAKATTRAREIGVRKVSGANRGLIISQFLGESVLLAALATIIGLILTNLGGIKLLSLMSDKDYTGAGIWEPKDILYLAAFPVLIGVLAGLYPALFLSAFRPIEVLKGNRMASIAVKGRSGGLANLLRKILVVGQFAMSAGLIIATLVVFKQLRFMQQKNLGYDREYVVTLPMFTRLEEKFPALRQEFLRQPGVLNAGRSSQIPTERLLNSFGQARLGSNKEPVGVGLKFVTVDFDFVKTLNIPILAGRDFSPEHPSDSTQAYLLNEAAIADLGWKTPQEAVGQEITYNDRKGKIIGVMQNIHFESLHENILPLIFFPDFQGGYTSISVKLKGDNLPQSLAGLESAWKKIASDLPFSYTFLDASYNRLYAAELSQGRLFTVFALLAILVACLGLFGLAAFTTQQRVKEIGIRKVLGASVSGITALLAKDFIKLVLIAIVVASPLAWYLMRQWLEDFAYRIEIQWWMFVLAGVLAVGIAFLTISFQSVRAALANPVKSLRSE